MKIKVKNIFGKNEKIKEIENDINENIQYSDNKENEAKDQVKMKPKKTVENQGELKHRRKGAATVDNVNKSIKNNQKYEINNIKKYLSNLFQNKNKLSKGYYVLLFAMLVLGTISVTLAAKSYNLFEKENYATYNDYEENVAASSSIDSTSSTKIEEDIKKANEANVNIANATSKVVTKVITPKVVPLSFSKPLNGEILKIFSDEKVIYSKTLELWKTHDAIDIKSQIGENVKSIEKGKVEKVYNDSFYGMTVVIDHGQGYKSSYSNLDESIKVQEKQTITKGQIIGKISNTAIGEIKDEAHLHFMLLKDNNVVDPTYIFK